jgi:hypothetical protein
VGLPPSELSAGEVLSLAREHAECEQTGELERLMRTMVEEPLFEFHPPGRCLRGGARIRRHYEQFLARFMPRVEAAELRGEWFNETATVHEYVLRLRIDGALEPEGVTAVLYASGKRLGGERIYGSERLIRLMLGESGWADLAPLPR